MRRASASRAPGGTDDAYICEIPAGLALKPQRHFFEELVYVIKGRGATTVWQEGGPRRIFEWQEGALFSPPFNAWHQHFNGSGDEPARLVGVTSAPIMIDLIHNIDFIFGGDYVFRIGSTRKRTISAARGDGCRAWCGKPTSSPTRP